MAKSTGKEASAEAGPQMFTVRCPAGQLILELPACRFHRMDKKRWAILLYYVRCRVYDALEVGQLYIEHPGDLPPFPFGVPAAGFVYGQVRDGRPRALLAMPSCISRGDPLPKLQVYWMRDMYLPASTLARARVQQVAAHYRKCILSDKAFMECGIVSVVPYNPQDIHRGVHGRQSIRTKDGYWEYVEKHVAPGDEVLIPLYPYLATAFRNFAIVFFPVGNAFVVQVLSGDPRLGKFHGRTYSLMYFQARGSISLEDIRAQFAWHAAVGVQVHCAGCLR